MKKLLLAYLLASPCLLLAQQIPKSLIASNGVFIGFYEYKPVDYNANPTTKYPVIIFLHGIGERGDGVTNLPLVLSQGIPKNINAGHTMRFFWNGKWETFLVLSPQLNNVYGDWQNFYIDEMLKYAKQNLRIDPDRVFLTGLSLGGGGVWRYASSSVTAAREFAGIAPVCGTCAIGNPCNISNANLPVWAFHALDDGVVGAGCTTSSILGINNCNPSVKPLMTLYPNGGHYIWGRSYDTEYNYHDPNMYEWFLGQNRALPANTLPIAKAGNDQTTAINNGTITLNGSGSTDADGNLVRYSWTKLSGPSSGIINTPISTNGVTTVTGVNIEGTYQYQLNVLDNRAGTSLDTISITVTSGIAGGNVAPFAKAGADIDLILPTNATNLNGASSYDPDGTIINFSWSKISGPSQYNISSPSNPTSSLTNLIQGSYSFQLSVTDNSGDTSKDTVFVVVTNNIAPPSNLPPIARAGSDISITLPSNSVNLNGYGSYDPDGTVVAYTWSKISGPTQYSIANVSGGSISVSTLSAGSYLFRLLITDNGGSTAEDTVLVVVNNSGSQAPPLSIAPLAKAGPDQSITFPTNSIILNGYNSYDPDGIIVSYNWSKISGPVQYNISNSSDGSTTATNLIQGTYQFKLSVTDNSGVSGADTVFITVLSGTPPPVSLAPIAKAGPNFSITLPANSAALNGNDSYDPDGIIVSYNWSKISGPAQYSINNVSDGYTTVTNLAQGSYRFRLSVVDNSGIMANDTITITVNFGTSTSPPGSLAPIAKAGPDIYITIPANSITLYGYNSYDPDGIINSFSWSKIGGSSQYQITNASQGLTTVTNLASGTYLFRLLVTDNTGNTADDTVLVSVAASGNGQNTSTMKIASEVSEQTVIEKITAYPNPATLSLSIRFSYEIIGQSKMIIYDAAGRTIKQLSFYKGSVNHEIPISVADLKRGIYMVEIVTDKRKRIVTRFSKQ